MDAGTIVRVSESVAIVTTCQPCPTGALDGWWPYFVFGMVGGLIVEILAIWWKSDGY